MRTKPKELKEQKLKKISLAFNELVNLNQTWIGIFKI